MDRAEQVEEAARLIWHSRPVSYYALRGHEHHASTTETAHAMALLYALTRIDLTGRGGHKGLFTPLADSIPSEAQSSFPRRYSRVIAAIQEAAMLRDDGGNGGGRPSSPRNVLGDRLDICSMEPKTGFFRDGCCNTNGEDVGSHTVCVVITAEFLEFSNSRGNDLSTPLPQFGFPGLRPGDRWCLCAPRWREALDAGCAPHVVLRATHEGALDHCSLANLKRFALDLA